MEWVGAFLILLAALSIIVGIAFYDLRHGVTDNHEMLPKRDKDGAKKDG
jgi:uncharacterized protein YxeA